jgi:hypothetical protein
VKGKLEKFKTINFKGFDLLLGTPNNKKAPAKGKTNTLVNE